MIIHFKCYILKNKSLWKKIKIGKFIMNESVAQKTLNQLYVFAYSMLMRPE